MLLSAEPPACTSIPVCCGNTTMWFWNTRRTATCIFPTMYLLFHYLVRICMMLARYDTLIHHITVIEILHSTNKLCFLVTAPHISCIFVSEGGWKWSWLFSLIHMFYLCYGILIFCYCQNTETHIRSSLLFTQRCWKAMYQFTQQCH